MEGTEEGGRKEMP